MLSSSALALATPYILKIIIDDIFPNGSYEDLITILSILVTIYVFRILSLFLFDVNYTKVSQAIISDIRIDLFLTILKQDISYFKSNQPGETVYLLTNDVGNIQDAISSLVLHVLNNILTITGIFIMLIILNYELTLLSLLIIPLIVFIINRYVPRIKKAFESIQLNDGNIYSYFLERIQNIRVLKSYNTFSFENNFVKNLHRNLINAHVKSAVLRASSGNLTTFLIAIGPVIVLIYGGRQVFEGAMSLGSLIAFIQYLNKLYAPAISLVNSYNDFAKAQVSMRRVYEPFKTSSNITKQAKVKINSVDSINLQGVSIEYDGRNIIEDVVLNFKRGNIYGIVGDSGSGKTSLVNLLCGFLPPSKGKVLINDSIPIGNVMNWVSNIALIEKEHQLFSGDIMFNIQYGSDNPDFINIKNAIENTGLTKIFDNLDLKEKTIINDSGSRLSDGQKQLISITRALSKNPSVLIFDEATSSLDLSLENSIFQYIRRTSSAIVIFITHRPSSLKHCDYIYSMDKKALGKNENVYNH